MLLALAGSFACAPACTQSAHSQQRMQPSFRQRNATVATAREHTLQLQSSAAAAASASRRRFSDDDDGC